MNDNQQFNEILDQALSEYRDAAPLAGLEDRVLRRLSAQPAARRRSWLRWGLAAACAAILLASAGVILQSRLTPAQRESASSQPNLVPSATGNEPETKAAPQLETKATLPVRPGKTAASLPILAASVPEQQVPMPVRTTAQEQALAVIATAHPDALAAANREPQPLAISPLEITPLTSVNQHVGED